jgi:hypothetical protein
MSSIIMHTKPLDINYHPLNNIIHTLGINNYMVHKQYHTMDNIIFTLGNAYQQLDNS